MASSFTARDASKDGGGREGGRGNDEENECKGIRRGEGGGFGNLARVRPPQTTLSTFTR